MSIDDYRRFSKQIKAYKNIEPMRSLTMLENLKDVYVQDGALAGEKFYGNKMITKARIILDIEDFLKEQHSTSPH